MPRTRTNNTNASGLTGPEPVWVETPSQNNQAASHAGFGIARASHRVLDRHRNITNRELTERLNILGDQIREREQRLESRADMQYERLISRLSGLEIWEPQSNVATALRPSGTTAAPSGWGGAGTLFTTIAELDNMTSPYTLNVPGFGKPKSFGEWARKRGL